MYINIVSFKIGFEVNLTSSKHFKTTEFNLLQIYIFVYYDFKYKDKNVNFKICPHSYCIITVFFRRMTYQNQWELIKYFRTSFYFVRYHILTPPTPITLRHHIKISANGTKITVYKINKNNIYWTNLIGSDHVNYNNYIRDQNRI